MKDYDGPAYKHEKGDDSIKHRRFNRLSQSDSAKFEFKPALKQTRSLESTPEFDTTYSVGEQRSRRNLSGQDPSTADEPSFSKQLDKRSGVVEQQNQRPTPPEDYQVPFLKHHSTKRQSLNQTSLEGTMAERHTQPSNPKRQVPAYTPPSAREERYSNEANTLTESEATAHLNTTQATQSPMSVDTKPKFQPTYLPKSTQVEDNTKKNSVAERELARRLVKTKDMFLLFDH